MTGPPPPDPKLTVALQWSELDPMEKATFAEKMGMNELAMYEAQSGGEPAHITKTKSDMAKEMMKSKKHELNIHRHEATDIEDDYKKGVRRIKIKNTRYFFMK